MRSPLTALALAVMALGAAPARQQTAPAAQTPAFRSSVDLVQLDVSVLDKDRQPVRGLTAGDFTVLENGVPRVVEGFAPVDLPDAVATSTTAAWQRDVTPDVTTNAVPRTGRVLVIVLDDGLMPSDLWAVEAARKGAVSIVNRLGPDDLAAVVFTMEGHGAQGLTNDRTKLLAAVNSLTRMGNTPLGANVPTPPPPCIHYLDSLFVVQDATRYLAALPGRRKSLVYFSGGMALDIGAASVSGPLLEATFVPPPQVPMERKACGAQLVGLLHDVFTNAALANVAVYGIDPMGLRPGATLGSPEGNVVEYLQTISDNTGGHAIVNTNDFEPGIAQIFRENSSYYLIGYRPGDTKADGSIRRIEVKVDRPGVEVVSRRLYYAPAPPDAKKPEPPKNLAALAEIVPDDAWPMRIAVMPVATASGPVAAIALGLERSAPHDRVADRVELTVKAFTPQGDARGSFEETVPVVLPPSPAGETRTAYDLLASLPLKPGRYQLRVSAHSTATDTRGSVYADVDVPDFAKAPIALSGVLVTVAPTGTAAPRLVLSPFVPVVPTSTRTFATTDHVSTFLRVYEGGGTPALVDVAITLVDVADKTLLARRQTFPAEVFRERGVVDLPFVVPVARLAVGEYLLTFDARAGKGTSRRDVRFRVQ